MANRKLRKIRMGVYGGKEMNYLREELENGVTVLDRSNEDRYKADKEEQEDEDKKEKTR